MSVAGFLLDVGVTPKLLDVLMQLGHQALHIRDLDMLKAQDERIVELAASRGLVVITSDTDLATVVAVAGNSAPPVVTLRLANPSAEQQVSAVTSLLQAIGSDGLEGYLVTVERGRYRRRRLPLR